MLKTDTHMKFDSILENPVALIQISQNMLALLLLL